MATDVKKLLIPGMSPVNSSLTTEQNDLLESFRQVLRAELNTFGAKYVLPMTRRQQGRAGTLQRHNGIGDGHDQPAPHAWVGRSIRSFAAAAETGESKLAPDMTALDSRVTAGDSTPTANQKKRTATFARRRKRSQSHLSDGSLEQTESAASLTNVLPMSDFRSDPTVRKPCGPKQAPDPASSSDGTRLAAPVRMFNGSKQSLAERRSNQIPSFVSSDCSVDFASETCAQVPSCVPLPPQESPQPCISAQHSGMASVSSMASDDSAYLQHVRSAEKVVALERLKDAEAFTDAIAEGSGQVSDSDLSATLSRREPSKHLMKMMSTIVSSRTLPSLTSFGKRTQTFSPTRKAVYNIVRHIYFENVTVFFILVNAVTIGIHTDHDARNLFSGDPPALRAVNLTVAAFFCVELLLRLFAFQRHFFKMDCWRWNVLDLIVVGLQVIEEFMSFLNLEKDSSMPVALSLLRLVRILRLIRVIRLVRLLRYMSELRTLVVSISGSMKPLISTIVLLAAVVYVVGIYFTQLTTDYRTDNVDSVGAKELEEYFGSVGLSTISLFQTVTGGLEWRHMLLPLMNHISPAMAVVFSLYIVFTSLALMNIVTGVFVETALQRGREDKDVYMINHLKELFGILDENRNGIISWDEVAEHLDNQRMLDFFKDIDVDISEAKGLFNLLDRDGSGAIDADEFLSGCYRLRGPAKALDLQLVMLELADQRKSVQLLLERWGGDE